MTEVDVADPPCVKPKRCEYWDSCAKERWCCGLFAAYVGKRGLKVGKQPSREIYDEVYGEEEEVEEVKEKVRLANPNGKEPDWLEVRHVWMLREGGLGTAEIAALLGIKQTKAREWVRNIRTGWWVLVNPRVYMKRDSGQLVTEDEIRKDFYFEWKKSKSGSFRDCLRDWERENDVWEVK